MPRKTIAEQEQELTSSLDWVAQPHRAPLIDQLADSQAAAAKTMRALAGYAVGMSQISFAWELEALIRERGQ